MVSIFVEELKKTDFWDRVLAIGLLPPPEKDPIFKKFFEEITPEEKRQAFPECYTREHVEIILNDFDIEDPLKKLEFKAKVERTCIDIVKNNKLNLWIDVFLFSDIVQLAMDSKFEFFDLLARAEPLHDAGFLEIIRLVVLHKNMVLQKFDRYVVCYVLAGSIVKGRATVTSDVDTFVVIDDTDVKRHTPWELKQKLYAIIGGMALEAKILTGTEKNLHVQVYTLTEFWRSLKEVNPVIVTFVRDGIPIYDRGLFIPWKLLLKRGEIKPSPEAVENYLNIGNEFVKKVKEDVKRLIIEDLYYSMLYPAQAAVMNYGFLPPDPKETPIMLRELFVNKEKILEEEYVKDLEEIIKIRKDVEHGRFQGELTGKDIDKWLEKAEKFINRMRRLVEQINVKKEKEETKKILDQVKFLICDLLNVLEYSVDINRLKELLEDAYKKGKIPESLYKYFVQIEEIEEKIRRGIATETDYQTLRNLCFELLKEGQRILERYLAEKLIRRKLNIKIGDMLGEIYFFDDYLLIRAKDKLYCLDLKTKEIKEISTEEFERKLIEGKTTKSIVLEKDIEETLRKIIGEFEIII